MRYDYKCEKCNQTFTINKPMSDCATPEYCPSCHKEARRVFNPLRHVWGEGCWDLKEDRSDFELTHRS